MKFHWKIFFSIFVTSAFIGIAATALVVVTIQRTLENNFVDRYKTLSRSLGHSLEAAEQSVKNLSIVGARYLKLYVEKNGIPSEDTLRGLTKELAISQYTIINSEGKFIRDTITTPDENSKNLYEFCEGYRGLVTGASDIETTPIIPSYPYKGPFKFTMIPSTDRKYILEVGMRINEISALLTKTIQVDPQLLSVGVLSPSGFNFGTITNEGKFIDGEQQQVENLDTSSMFFSAGQLTLFTKVHVQSEQCCECKTKGVDKGDGYYYIVKTEISDHSLQNNLRALRSTSLLFVVILLIASGVNAQFLSHRLVDRLAGIEESVRQINQTGDLTQRAPVIGSDEVASLAQNFNQMTESLQSSQQKIMEQQKGQALGEMARQLAHDIRSPLTALNMVTATLDSTQEEKRVIIRSATQRINDIANDLLKTYRESKPVETSAPVDRHEPVMLVSLLDSVMSEKRMQYREKLNLRIEGEFSKGYGLFAVIPPAELARAISNLLNNAVESFDDEVSGTLSHESRIVVSLEAKGRDAVIVIEDNGRGISAEILPRVGKERLTLGKEGSESGSGLGVLHAMRVTEQAKGTLKIDSQLGRGTRVTLSLPRAQAPGWFVEKLTIQKEMMIVSVDDDQTVHQIWDKRIHSELSHMRVQHHVFSAQDSFETWWREQKLDSRATALCLIDYEFLGQAGNGLHLIERLGLAKQAVLVTSRFHEPDVQVHAARLQVKILPKALAPAVPFATR